MTKVRGKVSSDKQEDGLSEQQETFCREYLVHLNATKAALAAGYSAETAGAQASRLLKNVKIREYIKKETKDRFHSLGLSADFVLLRLIEIGSVDISEAYGNDGNLLPVHEIPAHVRRAISGVETYHEFQASDDGEKVSGTTTKVKFWDKNKALENLGRYLKLFVDKVEIKDGSGLAEKLAKARKRTGK